MSKKTTRGSAQIVGGRGREGLQTSGPTHVWTDPDSPSGLTITSSGGGTSIETYTDTKEFKTRARKTTSGGALSFHQAKPEYGGAFAGGGRRGEWHRCDNNGKLRVRGNYQDDAKHGPWVCWDENGRRCWEGFYERGKLIYGRQFSQDQESLFGERYRLQVNAAMVTALKFSKNARSLAILASAHGEAWHFGSTVMIWELTGKDPPLTIEWPAEEGTFVRRVEVSADGSLAALTGQSRKKDVTEIWDVAGRRKLHTLPSTFIQWMAFSHDNKRLLAWDGQRVSQSDRRTLIHELDVLTGLVGRSKLYGRPEALSPDGRLAAVRDDDHPQLLNLLDLQSGANAGTISAPGGIRGVAFLSDGGTVAVHAIARSQPRVLFWNAAAKQNMESAPVLSSGLEFARFGSPQAAVLSPDGYLWEQGVESPMLFDLTAGREMGKLEPRGGLFASAFSPNGKTIAAVAVKFDDRGNPTNRRALKFWEMPWGFQRGIDCPIDSGPRVGIIGVPAAIMAFSPDSRLVAAATSYGEVFVWDIARILTPPSSDASNRPPTVAIAKVEKRGLGRFDEFTVQLQGTDPDGDEIAYQYRTDRQAPWRSAWLGLVKLSPQQKGTIVFQVRAVDRRGAASEIVEQKLVVGDRGSR